MTIGLSASQDSVCPGYTSEIFTTAEAGTGNYNYSWNTGDSTADINVYPMVSQYYYVTVSDGLSSVTDSIYIVVRVLAFCFSVSCRCRLFYLNFLQFYYDNNIGN